MADNTSLMPAYLTMADLDTQEKNIAQQQALAQQLRQSAAPMQRMDRGSQAARALSGLMSGIAMRKANVASEQFSKDKQGTLNTLKDQYMPGWRNRQNLPIAPPAAPIDYSQYGDAPY